jgi:hypothetical protein
MRVSAADLLLGECEVCLAQMRLMPHCLQGRCGAHTRLLCLLLLSPLHVRQQPEEQTTESTTSSCWASGSWKAAFVHTSCCCMLC